MRNMDVRLRKLEAETGDKRINFIWWNKQSEAELQAEIAEREAEGFSVMVVRWVKKSCDGGR